MVTHNVPEFSPYLVVRLGSNHSISGHPAPLVHILFGYLRKLVFLIFGPSADSQRWIQYVAEPFSDLHIGPCFESLLDFVPVPFAKILDQNDESQILRMLPCAFIFGLIGDLVELVIQLLWCFVVCKNTYLHPVFAVFEVKRHDVEWLVLSFPRMVFEPQTIDVQSSFWSSKQMKRYFVYMMLRSFGNLVQWNTSPPFVVLIFLNFVNAPDELPLAAPGYPQHTVNVQ